MVDVQRTNIRWPDPYFSGEVSPEVARYLSELIRQLRLFDSEIFSQDTSFLFEASRLRPFVEVSTDYSMGQQDAVVLADASATSFRIDLPDVLEAQYKHYDVKKIDTNGATVISVEGAGQDLPIVLNSVFRPSITLYSDGTNYWII